MSAIRERLGATVAALALALALIGAPSASASIEVGDECAANTAEGPYSLVPEAHASGGAQPLATPTGGVVTAWKVNSARPEPVLERMAAFRPTGAAGTFKVAGESNEESVNQGLNAFSTRIPVQAGDRFGPVAVTVDSPLFCGTGNAGDLSWAFNGSVGIGSTHTFAAGVQVRVPMIAVIEPDKDGDGYGDETQDGCPQSAAYQGECPRVELGVVPIIGKKAVTLLVTTSITATVSMYASVAHHRSMHLGSSPYRNYRTPFETISPGQITPLRLYFYRSLRSALEKRSPEKGLMLNVVLTAPNLTGPPTTQSLALHLKRPGETPQSQVSRGGPPRPVATLRG